MNYCPICKSKMEKVDKKSLTDNHWDCKKCGFRFEIWITGNIARED